VERGLRGAGMRHNQLVNTDALRRPPAPRAPLASRRLHARYAARGARCHFRSGSARKVPLCEPALRPCGAWPERFAGSTRTSTRRARPGQAAKWYANLKAQASSQRTAVGTRTTSVPWVACRSSRSGIPCAATPARSPAMPLTTAAWHNRAVNPDALRRPGATRLPLASRRLRLR
jgi:hypothetical protein